MWKIAQWMGSLLPLLGIAALMVFGFVVLLTALSHDASAKPDSQRIGSFPGERRPQREQLGRQVQLVFSSRRGALRALPVTLYAWAMDGHSRPRVRHRARGARLRWLTFDSTTGQLIAAAAASVVAGCLIGTLL